MDLTPPSSRSGMLYTSPEIPVNTVGAFVMSEARRLHGVYQFFRSEPVHGPLGHGRLDVDAAVRSTYRNLNSQNFFSSRNALEPHPSLNKQDNSFLWLKRPRNS